MSGLTNLGIAHTAISLVAIVSGAWSLSRDKQITKRTPLGQTYLLTTLLTAASGLGIFQHGGFGPPHALSLLTLLALVVGGSAELTSVWGRRSALVQTVSYSTTILFHLIPGVTEWLTRLPPDQPLLSSAESPTFKPLYGLLILLYLAGLTLQLRWLRERGQLR
jgi:uncharacterized membrane protein